MALNPHHLELFHYVARFGGIAQASKRMPYGVGQPAISLQITRLEDALGVTLFQRRPFKLTKEGEKLAAHIEPFFRGLERIETELRGKAAPLLRIGATELVQREHLPDLLDRLRETHPTLRISLRDATPEALTDLVRAGELDVAVFMTAVEPPKDLRFTAMITAKPVLLVPSAHPARSAEEILAPDHISAPLVCLPPQEPACVAFRALLEASGRIWEPALEVATQSLVHSYVKSGYGIGLGLDLPGHPTPDGLRSLPLPGAPLVTGGILTGVNELPVKADFIRLAEAHAATLSAPAAQSAQRAATSTPITPPAIRDRDTQPTMAQSTTAHSMGRKPATRSSSR